MSVVNRYPLVYEASISAILRWHFLEAKNSLTTSMRKQRKNKEDTTAEAHEGQQSTTQPDSNVSTPAPVEEAGKSNEKGVQPTVVVVVVVVVGVDVVVVAGGDGQ